MARKRFLSIGECMLEFSQAEPGKWHLGFAGDTLNTAWYFCALSDETAWETAYFTRLGTDRFSDRILAFLGENGIGTGSITRDAERNPGLYLIDVDKGERSFTYWRGQSAAKGLADDEVALGRAIMGSEMIYFSGITLAILPPDRRRVLTGLMAGARRGGRQVVFDPNIRPRLWENPGAMREAIMVAAGSASLILPSFEDESAHFGDASLEACAARYRHAGAGEIVVKNGGGPIFHVFGRESGLVDGLPRVEPVDTTGAGDSFNGAFLAARLAGAAPAEAIARAHAMASRVVRHHGALMPAAQIRDAVAGEE